ncbi:DNA-directed RNA polymerase III subunit RPC3 isoform A [Chlorella sorokiniana]|uniref:DNA-directed RNA polymerase III subunit RPC3 n=1 Tax=Chlorella sorokiniana TaxID=3076 RepID=A0A2P6U5D3_CHLSO|nr:DNA-directed RNA polymerase III subunit RPC3 isoform B [Chlorella sorokiniana]PRW61529.1 DNA-directed RNA polymerase III subunit RPC3 isoform A [Chlorella sorokiniana]|eukprot:PRW61528.1 DNA-directed RNA polymerase III subunit RPC3 isoform B [Chlorella sorokiniana]
MAQAVAAPLPLPANRGPYAARLALKLVEEALGPLCRAVLKCLLDHGMQQYGDLARTSKLPQPQLRAGLLVLIQHNYVNVYLKQEPPTLRGPGPSYSLYEAALPRILQGLRMPRFLTYIMDEHGPTSQQLICTLLEHGRLRWDQVLGAVTEAAAKQEEGEDGEEGDGSPPPTPDVVLNQFRSLVIERFIERVPPCTLPPPAKQVHPNARKKVATPKPGSEEEAALHREQSEALVRQAYQEERFQLPADLLGGQPGKAGDEYAGSGKAGDKRKRGKDAAGEEPAKKKGRKKADAAAAAADEATAAGGKDGEKEAESVLWRVNYDEFNRRFRNEVIVETVKAKYGQDAGNAVLGLLLANARFEASAQTGETVVLGVNEISSALRRQYGNDLVPEHLGEVLSELSEDVLQFLEAHGHGPGGEQFVMNIPQVLNLARLLELESVVRNKFGEHGMRIWRLLFATGQLEQKQVSDMAMLTKEEAREKLYAMLKAGYVTLQDVPRTADHAPSRTFYTWRAKLEPALARLSSDLYRAAGNLHARLMHELDRNQELLDMLETPGISDAMIQRRTAEIAKLKAVTSRLEAALLDLDAQICIFADV